MILDTRASRYFSTNWEILHDYEDTTNREYVFMENLATTRILEKWKVILKLTSRKTLYLSNVLYVPSLHRNLVFGSLLNWASLKIVLEGDKVILIKNGDFVGKGYLFNGLFVLNIVSMNTSASSSTYIVEFVDMWHGRLVHAWDWINKGKILSSQTNLVSLRFEIVYNDLHDRLCLKAIVLNEIQNCVDLHQRLLSRAILVNCMPETE